MVIFMLIVIDFGVRDVESKLMAEPAQMRLVTQETDSFDSLLYNIQHSEGYNIVFLGDSTVYGPSGSSRETIPFFLEQELRKKYPNKKVNIFNLSYKGYGVSENFFLLNALKKYKVDLVIYGLNMNWLNRNQTMEYYNPVALDSDIFKKPSVDALVNPKSLPAPLNHSASHFLTDNWALYRNRSNIAALTLHKSLAEKLYDQKLQVYNPDKFLEQEKYWKDITIPWFKKSYKNSFAKDPNKKFGQFNLDGKNPQVQFLTLFMDLVNTEKIPALIYSIPVNTEMFNSYKRFDPASYDRSRKKLENLVSKQVNFADLSFDVPGRDFADSIHLLPSGHKVVAHKLTTVIEKKGFLR